KKIGNITKAAELAAETAVEALRGKAGPAYDSLVYSCALSLWHCGRHPTLEQAATQVRQVLDSGQAALRLV
ncbi:MAG: anthranilate phosphoribosyltransferase, partial [Candidatus Thiodiazotropha sp.]